MDERLFNTGAQVVSLDGQDVGHVEQLAGEGSEAHLVVRLADGNRTMMVPYDVIDNEQSTEDRVVIQGAVGDLLEPRMELNEHETQSFGLVAEEAIAHVHEVDRGRLLIDKTVEMVPHQANVDVGTDRVEVERVPVNEEVDSPPQVRQDGDTLVVPVIEEVLVVTKRYRIIEEVRVTKYRDIRTETFEDELKREVVTVTEEDVEGNVIDR
jgi:stress response protein YsnF